MFNRRHFGSCRFLLNLSRQKSLSILLLSVVVVAATVSLRSQTSAHQTLSAPFVRHVMAPVGPESPLELRQFVGPVKTDSRGNIITGPNNDPVKNIVGAE